jgi:hypothetical protein
MEHRTGNKGFLDILRDKADQFAYQVYRATKDFLRKKFME